MFQSLRIWTCFYSYLDSQPDNFVWSYKCWFVSLKFDLYIAICSDFLGYGAFLVIIIFCYKVGLLAVFSGFYVLKSSLNYKNLKKFFKIVFLYFFVLSLLFRYQIYFTIKHVLQTRKTC